MSDSLLPNEDTGLQLDRLSALADELVLLIFDHLPISDLQNMTRLSRRLRALATSHPEFYFDCTLPEWNEKPKSDSDTAERRAKRFTSYLSTMTDAGQRVSVHLNLVTTDPHASQPFWINVLSAVKNGLKAGNIVHLILASSVVDCNRIMSAACRYPAPILKSLAIAPVIEGVGEEMDAEEEWVGDPTNLVLQPDLFCGVAPNFRGFGILAPRWSTTPKVITPFSTLRGATTFVYTQSQYNDTLSPFRHVRNLMIHFRPWQMDILIAPQPVPILPNIEEVTLVFVAGKEVQEELYSVFSEWTSQAQQLTVRFSPEEDSLVPGWFNSIEFVIRAFQSYTVHETRCSAVSSTPRSVVLAELEDCLHTGFEFCISASRQSRSKESERGRTRTFSIVWPSADPDPWIEITPKLFPILLRVPCALHLHYDSLDPNRDLQEVLEAIRARTLRELCVDVSPWPEEERQEYRLQWEDVRFKTALRSSTLPPGVLADATLRLTPDAFHKHFKVTEQPSPDRFTLRLLARDRTVVLTTAFVMNFALDIDLFSAVDQIYLVTEGVTLDETE